MRFGRCPGLADQRSMPDNAVHAAERLMNSITLAVLVLTIGPPVACITVPICCQLVRAQAQVNKPPNCPKCGRRIQAEWKFCKYCGANLTVDSSAINALYATLASRMNNKDFDGVMSLLATGCKTKVHGRIVDTRAEFAHMKEVNERINIPIIAMKATSIHVTGGKAEVISQSSVVMEVNSNHDKRSIISVSRDVLVKTTVGWKFQLIEQISQRTTTPGVPGTEAPGRVASPATRVPRNPRD